MNIPRCTLILPLIILFAAGCSTEQNQVRLPDLGKWKIHDPDRPLPPVVTPPPVAFQKPPGDATVLFTGGDLSGWTDGKSQPARWRCEDDYMEVAPETGSIQTKESFGDCQLHVEWAAPAVVKGDGQGRGNSGVYLMGLYEVQVLDSYENKTYADGQAAAVYGQYPPLVNVCRPPGQWQSYDIIFHGPRFDKEGTLLRPATMTVFHNGVLVQDHVTLTGPTAWKERPPYKKHPEKLPLALQDHGNPVRYRNIWIRELK